MRFPVLFIPVLALTTYAQSDISLGKPNAVLSEPFNDAIGMAEYADGRVIVADRISTEFVLVDFAHDTRKTLGRKGAGPNEYLSAFGVVAWRGDTLLGFDGAGRRYARFAPGGMSAGELPFPTKIAGVGFALARGVDRSGRMYYDMPVIEMPAIKRSMKARLLRWTPGTDSAVAIGEIADHASFEHQFTYRPFPQTDAWVLGADGLIGIVSSAEYRLRWYQDGALVETGPPIPFTPIRVTAAERDAFRAKKAMEPVAGVGMGRGGAAASAAIAGERVRAAWGDTLFPAQLPPFEAHAAMIAPNGDIWVRRTVPASAAAGRVDVLDTHGKLRGAVVLPVRGTLFALGAHGVYVLMTDDDGLQTLQRYPYPVIR